jgi:hypothetical protein
MAVGLTKNLIKEELSMCYSHALASSCGLNFERPRIDNDSVDAELVYRGKKDKWIFSSPRIFIQFKATSSPRVDKDGNLKFTLGKKNYDDLRLRSQIYRVLVVCCLPNNTKYVEHHPTHVHLKGKSFWFSLLGLPSLRQSQKNIFIKIPKTNIIDEKTFLKMLENSACDRPLSEGLI